MRDNVKDVFKLSYLPLSVKCIYVNFLTGEVHVEYEPQAKGVGFPFRRDVVEEFGRKVNK